jgi:secreted Zn-dependent insulinase-like peptidase
MPETILKNGIIVSERDDRIYENFTLDNGLEVLLVIDETLKRSAACLNIEAGYYYDEIPGTAHLLEHLLFMGTKTEPDISFEEYLKSSLGETNAFTGAERTIYYFECVNEEFEKVLKRFSDFFYEPLLRCEDIDSQIEVIEKEKILSEKEDIRRVIQILKENIKTEHPYKKFSIGSEKTLSGGQSVNIYAKVTQFFEKYYLANFMKLVVISRKNMKDAVIKYFSRIRGLKSTERIQQMGSQTEREQGSVQTEREQKSGQGEREQRSVRTEQEQRSDQEEREKRSGQGGEQRSDQGEQKSLQAEQEQKSLQTEGIRKNPQEEKQQPEVLTKKQVSKQTKESRKSNVLKLSNNVFTLEPYRNTHKIFLVWPLPETISDFLEKPFQYVVRMLVDTSEGTPAFLLRNWIKEVQDFSVVQKDLTILILGITLNDRNVMKYKREIVAIFLEYIRIIRETGIRLRYFNEMKTVSMKEFFFRSNEKTEIFEYAKELAENMLLFPKKYYVIGPYIYEKFNREKIKRLFDFLTPEEMQIFIVSQEEFRQNTSKKKVEKYFEIEYTSESVEDFLIDAEYIAGVIDNIDILKDLEVLSNLSVPKENELIPENFELKPRDTGETMLYPVIIENNEFIRVWYKQDTIYQQPISFHFIEFSSPILTENPLSNITGRIFVELIRDLLKGLIYKSNLAGVYVAIEFVSNTIEIHVSGFSDKQHYIIDLILYKISRLKKFKDEWTLERVKNTLKTEYFSSLLQPYEQGLASVSLVVEGYNNPSTDQELRIIDSIQVNDVKCFVSRFLNTSTIELFANGNVTREETLKLSEIIKKNIKPRYIKIPHQVRIVKIPQFRQIQKKLVFEIKNEASDSEFAVVNYYQLGLKTIENSALIDIIEGRITLNLFHELRISETKSYFTFSSHIDNASVLGFVIAVQTNDKNPKDIENQIGSILERTLREFETMSSDTLKGFLEILANEKIGIEKDLYVDSQRLWNQIRFPYYHEFEKPQKKADIIRNMDRKKITDFIRVNFIEDTRRLLTIRVLNKNQKESESPNEIQIKDLRLFKNSQESHFMFY